MKRKLILPVLILGFLVAGPVYAMDPNEEAMQKCQGKHPEWYQCVTDEDCVISLNLCGWPVLGVNKMHKGRSEICTRQAGAFIDCPMWKDTEENKMVSFCQQGVCESLKASEAPVKESSPDKIDSERDQ